MTEFLFFFFDNRKYITENEISSIRVYGGRSRRIGSRLKLGVI